MNQNSQSGFLSSIPVVTKNLIIINVLVWLASIVLPKMGIDLVKWLGLHFPGVEDFYLFQFVTYMFMHDTHSFAHVFFNMFGVYMFGRVLENVWGPKRFLIFYMVTGLGAGIVQELVWLYSVHSVAAANGITIGQQIAFDSSLKRDYHRTANRVRLVVELSDYDWGIRFRVRHPAGIRHAVSQCAALFDVYSHPD